MAQHLLLGDLAPLCLLAGLTGPLLRPILALPGVMRLRVLANPFVAFPIWAANLVLWHLPVLYEGAVESSALHALEHVCVLQRRDRPLAARSSRRCPRRSGSAPARSSRTSSASASSRR